MVVLYVISSGCPFLTSLSSQSQLSTFDTQKSPSASPLLASLTGHVTDKSFACHSYRKYPGWRTVEQASACFLFPQPFTLDHESPRFATSRTTLSTLKSPNWISSVSTLESTPTKHPAGVDSEPLTGSLKPLDATFTKNWGEGHNAAESHERKAYAQAHKRAEARRRRHRHKKGLGH